MATQLIEFTLWSRGGWPTREVAGESFHEAAIRSLFPQGLGEQGMPSGSFRAALLPEPTNKHDPHAVKVLVQGQHVGYLSREEAPRSQPFLQTLIDRGLLPVTDCRIWAAQYEEWDWHPDRREMPRRDQAGPAFEGDVGPR